MFIVHVGGGYDWVGYYFFDEASFLKMLASSKKIVWLITHYFGGNRTPKLRNLDFETTSKQGLRPCPQARIFYTPYPFFVQNLEQ